MSRKSWATLALALACLAGSQLEAGNRWAKAAAWNRCPPHPQGPCALPYDDQEKTFICMSRPIPPDWVVVGVKHMVNCNGLGNNAWVIHRLDHQPGAEMLICGNQAIPNGWAVVAEEHTIYCGHGVNAVRIRKM
jgi:hypothetical protein